jgi:hypothetical protein
MKNKIFTFIETINKREHKSLQTKETMMWNFISRRLVSAMFVLGLTLFISCTKEEIVNVNSSPKAAGLVNNATTLSTSYHIGQSYGGGIIFYIDATGQHGLIADITDTNYRMIKWGDSYFLNTGATGTAVGTGAANTKKIIAVQGTSYSYAALVCANYRGGGYADWFLPSKDELYLLYKAKAAGVVKGFTWGAYWSSSEFYVASFPKQQAYAWTKIFYSENAFYSLKDRVSGVRAIRAF